MEANGKERSISLVALIRFRLSVCVSVCESIYKNKIKGKGEGKGRKKRKKKEEKSTQCISSAIKSKKILLTCLLLHKCVSVYFCAVLSHIPLKRDRKEQNNKKDEVQ